MSRSAAGNRYRENSNRPGLAGGVRAIPSAGRVLASTARFLATTARRVAATAGILATVPLFLIASACDGSLDRPTGLGEASELDLEAGLLSPENGQAILAGDSALVRVIGSEGGGRLAALGFRVHSARPGRPQITSELVEFESGPVADSTIEFTFIAPDTLPDGSQLDFRAVGLGSDRVRVESDPVRVTVLQCPANAVWC